jgi:hypothetical protein
MFLLSGCAATVERVRGTYDNPAASDTALMKDHAECAREGEDASNGWLIASWATMPLALTVIGALIPIGLAGTAAAKSSSTRDYRMAERGNVRR